MIQKYNLDSSLVNYIDNLGMGIEARGAIGGTVYYVEGNSGRDSWDGLTIDTAFKTLAKAISVSHANIAQRSRWARRNTIYAFGDTFVEDLTAVPQKTDIVGCGSYDGESKPGLTGAHTIATAAAFGCRIFNFKFLNDGTDALWTIVGGSLDFLGNTFKASANSTHGLAWTSPNDVKIIGNEFVPDVDDDPFDTAAIAIAAGATYNCLIRDNIIHGDIGISIANAVYAHCHIDRNIIRSVTTDINDASDDWYITNNQCITAAANTTGVTASVIGNAALAANNILTMSNVTNRWPAETAID